VAELAGTANGSQTKQLDVRRKVFFAHRFFVHERGAQILLVVVAEDGDDGSEYVPKEDAAPPAKDIRRAS